MYIKDIKLGNVKWIIVNRLRYLILLIKILNEFKTNKWYRK